MNDRDTVLACDPDTHSSGLALVRVHDGQPLWVCCIQSKGKTGDDAVVAQIEAFDIRRIQVPAGIVGVVVESQEIAYTAKQGKNPASMIPVAQVAGAAAARLSMWFRPRVLMLVKPQAWKGSVPKKIHQARTLSKLGWRYETLSDYCRPYPNETVDVLGADQLNPGDWKHVVDAIALGQWMAEKLRRAEK